MKQIKTLKTPLGQDIQLIELGSGNAEKTVLIIGCFHGDEPQGEELITEFFAEHNPEKNRVLLIPCLNPDGKNSGKRTNSNGVDLNRNFPCENWVGGERDEFWGGESAGSEAETRFLTEVLRDCKIDAILSLHAPFAVVNYDGPAVQLADAVSKLCGYPVQKEIGYPTPGSFGTYCGVERGIPTITLELDENEPMQKLKERTFPVFSFFADEC